MSEKTDLLKEKFSEQNGFGGVVFIVSSSALEVDPDSGTTGAGLLIGSAAAPTS